MTLPEQKTPPPTVSQPTLPLEMPPQTPREEPNQDPNSESPTTLVEVVDSARRESCEPKQAWTTLDQTARQKFQKEWTAVMREVAANERSC